MKRSIAILLVGLVLSTPDAVPDAAAQDADSPLVFHDPDWSADGSHILFYSNLEDRANFDVYSVDIVSGETARLTEHPAYDGGPTASPDGEHIAFYSQRNGEFDLYVMDVDGSNVRRLTTAGGSTDAAWSPDGSRLAYTRSVDSNREVFSIVADGTDERRLTDHDAGDQSPTYTPDGDRIIFVSNRTGTFALFSMAADGADVRPVDITSEGIHHLRPDISPDGATILFSIRRETDPALFTVPIEGGAARRLTPNFERDVAAAYSPDGSKITYLCDAPNDTPDSGAADGTPAHGGIAICIANADGSDPEILVSP